MNTQHVESGGGTALPPPNTQVPNTQVPSTQGAPPPTTPLQPISTPLDVSTIRQGSPIPVQSPIQPSSPQPPSTIAQIAIDSVRQASTPPSIVEEDDDEYRQHGELLRNEFESPDNTTTQIFENVMQHLEIIAPDVDLLRVVEYAKKSFADQNQPIPPRLTELENMLTEVKAIADTQDASLQIARIIALGCRTPDKALFETIVRKSLVPELRDRIPTIFSIAHAVSANHPQAAQLQLRQIRAADPEGATAILNALWDEPHFQESLTLQNALIKCTRDYSAPTRTWIAQAIQEGEDTCNFIAKALGADDPLVARFTQIHSATRSIKFESSATLTQPQLWQLAAFIENTVEPTDTLAHHYFSSSEHSIARDVQFDWQQRTVTVISRPGISAVQASGTYKKVISAVIIPLQNRSVDAITQAVQLTPRLPTDKTERLNLRNIIRELPFYEALRDVDGVARLHTITWFPTTARQGTQAPETTLSLILNRADRGTLKNVIETGTTATERSNFTRQFVHTAAAMERRNVFHGDLKPENILADSQGQLHITDFGLSSFLGPNEPFTSFPLNNDNAYGAWWYSPPELLRRRVPPMQPAITQDPTMRPVHYKKIESWVRGCILFEMYFGRPEWVSTLFSTTYPPNLSDSARSRMENEYTKEVVALRERLATIPVVQKTEEQHMQWVICMLMHHNVDSRWTMEEAEAYLQLHTTQSTTAQAAPTQSTPTQTAVQTASPTTTTEFVLSPPSTSIASTPVQTASTQSIPTPLSPLLTPIPSTPVQTALTQTAVQTTSPNTPTEFVLSPPSTPTASTPVQTTSTQSIPTPPSPLLTPTPSTPVQTALTQTPVQTASPTTTTQLVPLFTPPALSDAYRQTRIGNLLTLEEPDPPTRSALEEAAAHLENIQNPAIVENVFRQLPLHAAIYLFLEIHNATAHTTGERILRERARGNTETTTERNTCTQIVTTLHNLSRETTQSSGNAHLRALIHGNTEAVEQLSSIFHEEVEEQEW